MFGERAADEMTVSLPNLWEGEENDAFSSSLKKDTSIRPLEELEVSLEAQVTQ